MVEKIEYEIEISAKSSQEIRELLNEINQADSKVARQKFHSQGAPIQTQYEDRAIFGGEMEGYAFPDQTRDRSSKQAIQRVNRFKELEKKVNTVEKTIKQSLITAAQGGNPLLGMLQKFAPFLGLLFIDWGIVDFWMDYLFKDGGPFDRRYKRKITTEVAELTSRQLKGQIRQGYADVRVTAIPNLRGGRNLSFTTLSSVNKGGVFSESAELLGKGL